MVPSQVQEVLLLKLCQRIVDTLVRAATGWKASERNAQARLRRARANSAMRQNHQSAQSRCYSNKGSRKCKVCRMCVNVQEMVMERRDNIMVLRALTKALGTTTQATQEREVL